SGFKSSNDSWNTFPSYAQPVKEPGRMADAMGANFHALLPLLVNNQVRIIVVGGGAAIAHGAARATYDVDVVYARDQENVRRLAAALQPHQPYLRGAPPGLPFRWDERTIQSGLNFTLTTDVGDLDLLGEVTGG